MIYKFLFYPICIYFLFGCGENYSAGVIQGGSGNGRPVKPENGKVVYPEPLNGYYTIKLSEPKTDLCHGVKRTIQFLNPLNSEIIEKEELLEISPQVKFNNQILVQVVWENRSDQIKTVFKSSCDGPIRIKDLGKTKTTDRIPKCDLERITTLPINTLHIINQEYKFESTFKGELEHSDTVEFLPIESEKFSCDRLEINFYIKNK